MSPDSSTKFKCVPIVRVHIEMCPDRFATFNMCPDNWNNIQMCPDSWNNIQMCPDSSCPPHICVHMHELHHLYGHIF